MVSISKSTPRPEFAAYVCDDQTETLIKPIVEDRGWPNDSVKQHGIAGAVRSLSSGPCPKTLLVDLSDSADPRADMQALAEVCDPETAVIALGKLNDATFFRDLIHAGVQDYMVKPVSPEVLNEAFNIAVDNLSAQASEGQTGGEATQTKLAVVGLRGGLGSSTIAANIAWAFSQKSNSVLLDLDLHFGTSALLFDLEPGRGLPDALDNPARVDGLFLERAIVKPSETLSILAAEAPIGSISHPREDAVENLVSALGQNYDDVVIDLPRQVLAENASVLQSLTDLAMICDLTISGARDCIRLLGFLEKNAPHVTPHVVVMKGHASADEVSIKDFENSIECEIASVIPFDTKTVQSATTAGAMILEQSPTSKVASAMQDLIDKMKQFQTEQDGSGKSWLKKLFG